MRLPGGAHQRHQLVIVDFILHVAADVVVPLQRGHVVGASAVVGLLLQQVVEVVQLHPLFQVEILALIDVGPEGYRRARVVAVVSQRLQNLEVFSILRLLHLLQPGRHFVRRHIGGKLGELL